MSRICCIIELFEIRRTVTGQVGLTSGVFDFFHFGHRNYLTICKNLCDFLIVGVDTDDRVRQRKGNSRPAQSLSVRLENLISSKLPDALFAKATPTGDFLSLLKPDIYFKSAKQTLTLRRIALHEELRIPLISVPYTENISTTQILRQRGQESLKKGLAPWAEEGKK
jgi:glycerol-3-phosphate cytidylyltransferase